MNLKRNAQRGLLLLTAAGLLSACWPDSYDDEREPNYNDPYYNDPYYNDPYYGPSCYDPGTGLNRQADVLDVGIARLDERAITGVLNKSILSLQVPVFTQRRVLADYQARLVDVRSEYAIASKQGSAQLSSPEDATRIQPEGALHIELSGAHPLRPGSPEIAHYALALEITVEGRKLSTRIGLSDLLNRNELAIWAPRTLYRNASSVVRLRLIDHATGAPVPETRIDVNFPGQSVSQLTDARGFVNVTLRPQQVGQFTLSASTDAAAAQVTLDVIDERQVLITTDKPLYQPGQTLHLRFLALAQPHRTPMAEIEGLVEIFDANDNKIHKERVTTNAYGVVSTTFKLAREIRLGDYRVALTLDDQTWDKTISVERYKLPRYEASITLDRNLYHPGDTVHGVVDARYLFGQPVSQARVVLSTLRPNGNDWAPDRTIEGTTNAAGLLPFEIPIARNLSVGSSGRFVPMLVTLEDPTGETLELQGGYTVAQDRFNLTLTAESGEPVPGVENRFFLRATSPLGEGLEEVACTLSDAQDRPLQEITTDATGLALFRHVPPRASFSFIARCTIPSGQELARRFFFDVDPHIDPLLLRVDGSLFEFGDTVRLAILAAEPMGSVMLDLVHNNRVLHTLEVPMESSFTTAEITLDSALESASRGELSGELRLEVRGAEATSRAQDARVIFVKPRKRLDIAMNTDKTAYEPGETAQITFSITQEDGAPTRALLGLQIVDEAVFVLSEVKPGQLERFFRVDTLAELPTQLSALLERLDRATPEDASALQTQVEATVAAYGDVPLTQQHVTSSEAYLQGVEASAQTLVSNDTARITQEIGFRICEADNDWRSAAAELQSQTWVDPWGQPYRIQLSTIERRLSFVSFGLDENEGTDDDISLTYYVN